MYIVICTKLGNHITVTIMSLFVLQRFFNDLHNGEREHSITQKTNFFSCTPLGCMWKDDSGGAEQRYSFPGAKMQTFLFLLHKRMSANCIQDSFCEHNVDSLQPSAQRACQHKPSKACRVMITPWMVTPAHQLPDLQQVTSWWAFKLAVSVLKSNHCAADF